MTPLANRVENIPHKNIWLWLDYVCFCLCAWCVGGSIRQALHLTELSINLHLTQAWKIQKSLSQRYTLRSLYLFICFNVFDNLF